MSVLKPISAMIDVVYSEARKNEMKISNQTDCVLIHNIVKKIISKYCYKEIKITVPTNVKDRYSDICFDFEITSEDKLIIIQNEIKNELKESLKSVEGFIFPSND